MRTFVIPFDFGSAEMIIADPDRQKVLDPVGSGSTTLNIGLVKKTCKYRLFVLAQCSILSCFILIKEIFFLPILDSPE